MILWFILITELENFSGLRKNRCTRKKQEAIKLLYRNNDLLYVSIHSLHKISKYNSKEGTAPKIHQLKNKGVNVFFITGNHDDPARSKAEFEDLKKDERFTKICTDLESFEFIDAYDYETINHGKILVIHGDQYDVVTSNAKWISKFGGLFV